MFNLLAHIKQYLLVLFATVGLSSPAYAGVLPVVTAPQFYPAGYPGHENDPWPYAPSTVIGPGPLFCFGPNARLDNNTCPQVRAKVASLRADNAVLGRILKARHGCFNHWPSVVTTPPDGINLTYRKCGRGAEFLSNVRAIVYSNNGYIDFALGGIPAGAEPGVPYKG